MSHWFVTCNREINQMILKKHKSYSVIAKQGKTSMLHANKNPTEPFSLRCGIYTSAKSCD